MDLETGYYTVTVYCKATLEEIKVTRLYVAGKGWRCGEKYTPSEKFFKDSETYCFWKE